MGLDVQRVKHQMSKLFDFHGQDIILASAKTGKGIHEIVGAVIDHIPAPEGDSNSALKALLLDSWFNSYRGVMCLIAIKDGAIKKVI